MKMTKEEYLAIGREKLLIRALLHERKNIDQQKGCSKNQKVLKVLLPGHFVVSKGPNRLP